MLDILYHPEYTLYMSRYQQRKFNQIQLKFLRELNAFKDRFRGVNLREPDEDEINIWMNENGYPTFGKSNG